MAGLGGATSRIVAWKRSVALAGAAMGAGGGVRMQEQAAFGPNPGALRMLVHQPAELSGPAPLVVVLHGCSQTAEQHAASAGWLQLADRLGFVVLAPEQASANNANRCFNWFEAADQRRGEGEPASIRAMIAHLVDDGAADPAQIFVTGLSAGGAMAAVMLATYPEVFKAGAVIAGLPFGVASSMQGAWGAMGGHGGADSGLLASRLRDAAPSDGPTPRLTIWHGTADYTVNVANGKIAAAQWAKAHGLAETPDSVEALDGRTRSQWRTEDGAVAVELHLLDGFGHGTPLAARGGDAVGFPSPYMLEAGVASSVEIARFWGIAPEGPLPAAAFTPGASPEPRAGSLSDKVMGALSQHVPVDVQRTIADALKKAGLA
jgi:poly(hydroxyalkanoate) depolymerase family esterase